MRFSRMKIAVGLLLPLGTFTGVALAHHDLLFTFSATPTTAGAVVSTTGHTESGTFIPASSIVHLPPGMLIAHADDLTSPVSPPPLNGDSVGQANNYGDLWSDGCGNYTTTIANATWVEPIGTGAPAGTVAELKLQATPFLGLTITKRAFIVKSNGDTFQSGAHYDISMPDMPDEFACSGSSAKADLTTYGFARAAGATTNRVVARNPATPGTYNVYMEYKDTSGALHQDAALFSVK
ncbi:hypothetical protein [Archangium sp.]|uniref:hypothetical protein n=1 Tax=Archangium sp. TaxID=1872627 RepID=UPI002D52BC47|nr:hypothetical protein [Archangium sp.]HYO55948.1 hypothetical protein [Archangium sp.]